MADEGTAPAMKEDIQLLMQEMGKLYQANERWKNEILDTTEKWKNEILDEMKQHFDVAVENIRHDLEGAHKDKLEGLADTTQDHEKRIRTLERRAGLAAV